MSDSANADSNEQGASMHEAREEILNTIADWDGRIIVATVASNIVRIQQIFDLAEKTGRRIVLTGHDVENIVRTAIQLKKLHLVSEKLLVKPKTLRSMRTMSSLFLKQVVWVTFEWRKMAIGRHRYVEIKDGDLVILLRLRSISKEAVVARVENLVYKAGGVVQSIAKKLRVSGHGSSRDLQLMMNIMKPKYLFPIQGEYRQLEAHAENFATEIGMYPEYYHRQTR